MSDKLLRAFLLFLMIPSGCLGIPLKAVCASEADGAELVKKHDDQWKKINAIQIFFTKNYKTSMISRSFPGCYWESEEGQSRSIVMTLAGFSADKSGKPVASEMYEDSFCDGKDFYILTIPRDKYPLQEIRFCDYFDSLKDQGGSAVLVPDGTGGIGADRHLRFPLPRYFFVPAEKKGMTLPELVCKYPSRAGVSEKNTSGDSIAEIVIADHTGQHEYFAYWELRVFINMDKGYGIDGYQFSVAAKKKPSVKMMTEVTVKKYMNVKGGFWIPSDWEHIQHNGDLAAGIMTNFVINNCRINDPAESRLSDFRFPAGFPVNELTSAHQPEKIHIWGSENKPIHSFDQKSEFWEYYKEQCLSAGELPKENRHIAIRISLIVLGLIIIVIALYGIYATNH